MRSTGIGPRLQDSFLSSGSSIVVVQKVTRLDITSRVQVAESRFVRYTQEDISDVADDYRQRERVPDIIIGILHVEERNCFDLRLFVFRPVSYKRVVVLQKK